MNGLTPQVSKAYLYLFVSVYDICQAGGHRRADGKKRAKTSHAFQYELIQFIVLPPLVGWNPPSQHGLHGGGRLHERMGCLGSIRN